jgi:hypothetical protein
VGLSELFRSVGEGCFSPAVREKPTSAFLVNHRPGLTMKIVANIYKVMLRTPRHFLTSELHLELESPLIYMEASFRDLGWRDGDIHHQVTTEAQEGPRQEHLPHAVLNVLSTVQLSKGQS